MRTLHAVLKGGLSLGTGQGVVQACSFVRSIILARLISVEDYGIAAAFAMTLALLEMISSLSLDKLLVQAPDGDEPAFQRTAHLVQVTRGIGNGLVLFVLAGLIARLFGVPQATWGFRCLALLPVIRGFLHLDSTRMQRDMRFGPAVRIDVIANVLVTLLAWPLAAWLHNYSAMLFLLILQVAAASVVSHWVAERRYGWSWQRRFARRMFSFGWPLVINGLLLYGIMQGDRVVIGSARQLFPGAVYTLKDLGEYSIAFSFVMAPAMFMANIATSLFLPVLSRARSVPQQFQQAYDRIFSGICLIATAVTIPCILAGPQLIAWIYGAKYAAAGRLAGWLAAMWGIRLVRTAPTLAALAHADTKAAMFSNLVRSVALGGSVCAAAAGMSLVWIAISCLVGELLALPTIFLRVRHYLSLRLCLKPLTTGSVGVALAALLPRWGGYSINPLSVLLETLATTAGTLLIVLAMLPTLRADVRGLAASTLDAMQIRGITNVRNA